MSRAFMLASLKGGVGKTTVSASLAYTLGKSGASVLAVDMDFGAGGLDIALSCENKAAPSFPEYLRGEVTLAEAAVSSPFKNVSFIASPICGASPGLTSSGKPEAEDSSDASDIAQAKIDGHLAEMKEAFDYIIFDMPAGGGSFFRALSSSPLMDGVILTATDGLFSVRAAGRTIFELSDFSSCPAKLIINGYSLESPSFNSEGIVTIMENVCCELLGVVPYEPEAERFLRDGVPLAGIKGSSASQAFDNIASRLSGKSVPLLHGIVSKRRKKHFY